MADAQQHGPLPNYICLGHVSRRYGVLYAHQSGENICSERHCRPYMPRYPSAIPCYIATLDYLSTYLSSLQNDLEYAKSKIRIQVNLAKEEGGETPH